MQRFFLSDTAKNKNEIIITDKNIINQISYVLRSKKGDKIICLFDDGKEHIVKLISFSKKEILGQILEERKNDNEINFELVLYQALPKSKDKWEFIIAKATELGVTKIIPMITSRTSAKYPVNSERIQKIIRESAEQSERGILPKISDVIDIRNLDKNLHFSSINSDTNLFVCDSFNKNSKNLLKIIEEEKTQKKSYGIIIGPEGGFSENEIKFLNNNNINSVNLGKRTLRVETATILSLGSFMLAKNCER